MAWNSLGEKRAEARKMAKNKIIEMHSGGGNVEELKSKLAQRSEKDLHSGMELLELDFLLSIIENTKGVDRNDVMMRSLTFNELHRRKQLDRIESNALAVYAVNEGNLFSKDIQCEAIKELTKRTTQESKYGS